MTALHDRLAGIAGTADEIIARHELDEARRALAELQAGPKLTTEAGLALVAIAAERRAAERARRAAELRALPTLADAEAHAAANQRNR